MQTCKWLVRKFKSTVAQTKALATAMPNLSLGVVVRSISLNIETWGTLQIALGRFRYLPTLNPKPINPGPSHMSLQVRRRTCSSHLWANLSLLDSNITDEKVLGFRV